MMDEEYFEHFGVKLDNKKVKKNLNRDNFANNENHFVKNKYVIEHWDYFKRIKDNINIERYSIVTWPPSYKYYLEDGELRLSDDFCKKYKKACLQVYDKNMNFFQQLDKEKFNEEINDLLEKNTNYIEVKNLNEFKRKSGIYIMILDEYKQVYIGQAKDIYQRIIRHWKTNPYFDKLIFPSIEKSNICIDSFGALDTTRIFVKKIFMKNLYSLDKDEEILVSNISPEYLANRICGGLRLNTDSDFLKGFNTINRRNFN